MSSEGRVADLNAVMHVAIFDDFAHDALMSVAEEMRLEGLHDLDIVAYTHSPVFLQVVINSTFGGGDGIGSGGGFGKLKERGRRNRWQGRLGDKRPD